MRSSSQTTRPTALLGRLAGWRFDHRSKAVGLCIVAVVEAPAEVVERDLQPVG